jgi:hypothetical protein
MIVIWTRISFRLVSQLGTVLVVEHGVVKRTQKMEHEHVTGVPMLKSFRSERGSEGILTRH